MELTKPKIGIGGKGQSIELTITTGFLQVANDNQ